MTATITPLHSNRMTVAEFEQRWEVILDTYGTTNRDAIARRDRAVATLLANSGWTQEEIGQRVGRPKDWVSRHLLFAGFLEGWQCQPITEGQFRRLWQQTAHLAQDKSRDDIAACYAEVARLLDEERGAPSARNRHGPRVVEDYGDGKWHRADRMAENLAITEEELAAAMARLTRSQGAWRAKGERKMVGRGVMYRVFRLHHAVSPIEIKEKLAPLIGELKAEGKKNHVALATLQNVHALAIQIQRQVDQWCQSPPGPGRDGPFDDEEE
jgi:hypothetical protein